MRLIRQFLLRLTIQKRAPLLDAEPHPPGPDKAHALHVASDCAEATEEASHATMLSPEEDTAHHHVFCPGELVG